MLLNSLPLNGATLGSGGPISIIQATINTAVNVASSVRATVMFYASATCAVAVSSVAHPKVTYFVRIAQTVATVGAATASRYRKVQATIASTAAASAVVTARVLRSVYFTVSSQVRGFGAAVTRTALRAAIASTPTATSSATARLIQHGVVASSVQIVTTIRTSDIPTGPATDERTFQLTAGDRTFVLPKD